MARVKPIGAWLDEIDPAVTPADILAFLSSLPDAFQADGGSPPMFDNLWNIDASPAALVHDAGYCNLLWGSGPLADGDDSRRDCADAIFRRNLQAITRQHRRAGEIGWVREQVATVTAWRRWLAVSLFAGGAFWRCVPDAEPCRHGLTKEHYRPGRSLVTPGDWPRAWRLGGWRD